MSFGFPRSGGSYGGPNSGSYSPPHEDPYGHPSGSEHGQPSPSHLGLTEHYPQASEHYPQASPSRRAERYPKMPRSLYEDSTPRGYPLSGPPQYDTIAPSTRGSSHLDYPPYAPGPYARQEFHGPPPRSFELDPHGYIRTVNAPEYSSPPPPHRPTHALPPPPTGHYPMLPSNEASHPSPALIEGPPPPQAEGESGALVPYSGNRDHMRAAYQRRYMR